MMKMIDTIMSCLANFTLRFENRNSSTQSSEDITPNARAVWVKKGTHKHWNMSMHQFFLYVVTLFALLSF